MPVGFNATAFRSKLQFGGARPNLYEVIVSFPKDVSAAVEEMTFMCRSTSLPGLTVGIAEVPYFGRRISFAGDRQFDDWQVRVINDEDFLVRNAFEGWQNRLAMIDHATNAIENAAGAGGHAALYCDAQVTQLAKDGPTALKQYFLKQCFPTSIGPIELAWDANDSIEEFDVTFRYDYFVTSEISGTNVTL